VRQSVSPTRAPERTARRDAAGGRPASHPFSYRKQAPLTWHAGMTRGRVLTSPTPGQLGPRSEWALRSRTPGATLRLEDHRRVGYVTRESLERSLATAVV